MNGADDSGDENTLKGFYAYKNTFDDETIWLDIPRNGESFFYRKLFAPVLIDFSHIHQHHESLPRPLHSRL